MKTTRKQNLLAAALVCALAFTTTIARAADPLPSWNDGKAKQSIIDFVTKVTKPGSPDFVPVAGAHRHVRQRRHALVRTADARSVLLRRSTA